MLSGEVHCLACGRYLADVTEGRDSKLRLKAITGKERPEVELRGGKAFCRHCGGRAFVEYETTRRIALPSRAA